MFFRQDASPTFRGSSLPAKRYKRLPHHVSNLRTSSEIIVSVPSGELEFSAQRGNRKRDKTVTLNMGRTRLWNLTNNLEVKVHHCGHSCCTLRIGAFLHRPVLTPPDPDLLSWQSSSWVKQREELSEHLCRGGLFQDSISRSFTFDGKDDLLRLTNLQPGRWTAAQSDDMVQPAVCSGYYQVTVLGKIDLWSLCCHNLHTWY